MRNQIGSHQMNVTVRPANEVRTYACPLYRDMVIRWRELGDLCQHILPQKFTLEPTPGEILKFRDDVDALARKLNPLVEAMGNYVSSYAGHDVDPLLFKNALPADELIGEIVQVARDLQEDLEDVR
jgi:hypothetical protein